MKLDELKKIIEKGGVYIRESHLTKKTIIELLDYDKVRIATLNYSQSEKIKKLFNYTKICDNSGFTRCYYYFNLKHEK